MKNPIPLLLLAFYASVSLALSIVTIIKSMQLEQRTLDLMRQVDEQRAQLAVHTKALNELYGRDVE